jgi:dTDP-4-amino-4,6-dideoxygalactose transaminase
MINVTKPFLPDLSEYVGYLEDIWERGWLTNNGPLVNKLESELSNYLETPNVLYLNNGTFALQVAIKALGLTGEIITTPFSYVATTSSIVWEGLVPIFADIDPNTFNINPNEIEKLITPSTSAILATHCFGNPCDILKIETIAKKHDLKVIYDAAHCFGTKYQGKSIFNFGDISTTSFHATKLFHTIEGGAVFSKDTEYIKTMAFMRNFGHDGKEKFDSVGVNGKNSEFHAAMGLVNLKHVDDILASRKKQCLFYDKNLKELPLSRPHTLPEAEQNYSYYPVLFESHDQLMKTMKALNEHWIYPRRYFYPSLNQLPYVEGQSMPVSEDISQRIICLPLYVSLSEAEQELIIKLIKKSFK